VVFVVGFCAGVVLWGCCFVGAAFLGFSSAAKLFCVSMYVRVFGIALFLGKKKFCDDYAKGDY
jgi:hypothetical protein